MRLFVLAGAVSLLASWLLFPAACRADIALTSAAHSYSQDFNGLASTGTTNSIMPDGWSFSESGSGANGTYGINNGSTSTGNTYSYGASGSSDRALGSLRGTTTPPLVATFGARFVNGETTAINSVAISYLGEHWRLGNINRYDQLDFQFSTNATSLTTGDWTDLNALDFYSVLTSGFTGAQDGNNTTLLVSGNISGLNVAPGNSLWIRWNDFDATGDDDGLAVDDFSITASFAPASAPEPTTTAALVAFGAIAGAASRFRRRKGMKKSATV